MLGTPRSDGCRRQLSFAPNRAIRLCGTADHVNVGCVVQSCKGGHGNCPRPQKKKIYRFPVLRFDVLRVGCCDSRAPELARGRADIQLELHYNRYNLTVHPPIEMRWYKIGELYHRFNVTISNRSDYIYFPSFGGNFCRLAGNDDHDS